MNALFFVAKTGTPWRDLPERFGPWKTVYARFARWNARGVFDRILQEFAVDADHESAIADSTYVRAHQHAAGGKGGPKINALDALAAVRLRKSMPSSTDWATPSTSTSPPATSMTSRKRRGSSK
jgi:transposase